jgi:hypothetical protein
MHTCCQEPRNEIVVLNTADKSCGNANAKIFNGYYLNKLQDQFNGYRMNFNDARKTRAFAKDAVKKD